MIQEMENPASGPADGDSIDTLFKLDDSASLTGLSDGVQAGYVFSPEAWRLEAESAAKALAAAGGVFTVDDLRSAGVGDPDVPQRWGSLFAVMQNAGVLQLAGLLIHRTTGGARIPIRQWQGVTNPTVGEV